MTADSNPQDWQSIANAKRAALVESIPLEWLVPKDILPHETQTDVTTFPETSGFFTERELEMTSTRIPDLLERIHSQTWTSEEVTKAFCKRAAVAHQLVSGSFLSNVYPSSRLIRSHPILDQLLVRYTVPRSFVNSQRT